MSELKSLLASGQDEAVSVNQRALVEKILARYAGEWTLFRELLQNSDDAGASTVEIHFRTSSTSGDTKYSPDALPNLKTQKCSNILVRNDGQIFRQEDWDRLKKIAEGNPDETKIGAFGVGFYSLFSICDEPVVSSGDKVMGFYWKNGGDQLFVKTAIDASGLKNLSPTGQAWSSFLMELREQTPMENPLEFAQFLTTCLGFTAKLRQISLHFDGHTLFRISKNLAPSREIPLPANVNLTSPLKILKLISAEEVAVQFRAQVSRWLISYIVKAKPPVTLTSAISTSFASKMLAAFSGKAAPAPPVPSARASLASATEKDPFTMLEANLFLRTVAGTLRVTASSHFLTEMVRATKKGLPSTTIYSLIWTGKDEFDASQASKSSAGEETDARKVFAGLLSDLDSNGRLFIGFPTFQTTGNASSIAARFVSTVERESIDFQAKYVSDWNRELLTAGGVLARTVFEHEMSEIGKLYNKLEKTSANSEMQIQLQERALHLFKFFTFSKSTPQEIVSSLTEQHFFASTGNNSITLISQLGPTPAAKLRLPNPALSGFIKSIPVVPALVSSGAPRLMEILRERALVTDISLEDVLQDLSAHPLKIEEAVKAFQWWISLAQNQSYNSNLLTRLKEAAMISLIDSITKEEKIYPLSNFKTFLNAKLIAPDLPLPLTTLPFELSRSFYAADLMRIFQLEELSLLEFSKHLVSPEMISNSAQSETNLLVSAHFAEKFLNTLARGWGSLSAAKQAETANILSAHAFIPTQQGAKLAKETYFAISLFPDLPIVTLPSGNAVKGHLERVLSSLGVRRHVELQLVFTRLLGQDGGWSHCDVISYLVSVRETLTTMEIDRLRKTAWLPKETELAKTAETADSSATIPKPRVVRYMASQLYEPTAEHRALGLPVVDWTSANKKWYQNNEEAKLLFELGLQKFPPLDSLLKIAATPDDPAKQLAALNYFLTQYGTHNFGSSYFPSKHGFAFIPAVRNGQTTFARPSEAYSNPEAACLGFAVLAEKFQPEANKFKLNRDPPSHELISAVLKNPPKSINEAKQIFGYLSSQISHFSSSEISTLQRGKIIPVENRLVEPNSCFFDTDANLPLGLKSLFVTIPDFGLAARPFLVAVGVKATPSPTEIASSVIADPDKFFELSGSSERYLSVLRGLAVNFSSLPSTVRSRMKMSSFFLGTKRISSGATTKRSLIDEDSDDEETGSTLTFQLSRCSDLAINDDPQAHRVFQSEIWSCPQEDSLEALAEALGANRISKLVTEAYRTVGEADSNSKRAADLHRAIVERTFLFLSERRQQYGKTELRHDAEWIQTHLKVFQVRSIELIRHLTFARASKRHSSAASAYAKLAPTGEILLYVAADLELDYFEVATGLCRLLLSKQRANDSLLFMTILTTSLKNLKRRGFNVDRILNARKAEREAADLKLRQERAAAQLKQEKFSPDKIETAAKQLEQLFPDADFEYLKGFLIRQENPLDIESAANALLAAGRYPQKPKSSSTRRDVSDDSPRMPGHMGEPSAPTPAQSNGVMSALQQQQQPQWPAASSDSGSGEKSFLSRMKNQFAKSSTSINSPLIPKPASTQSTPQTHQTGTTSQNTQAVRQNVRKAIQASRPETGSTIQNQVEKSIVKEQLTESYCDSSAGTNLAFVSDVSGLRFFLSRDVSDAAGFMRDNQNSIERFVKLIVKPIGQVFELDPRSLHIFYDTQGPLIAFNRNAALYINLRFYQAWHEADVVAGNLEEALISVYHTLAHEIAHNLVKPHDAEHSFYFSSLCEEYFLRMAQLLAKVQNNAQLSIGS